MKIKLLAFSLFYCCIILAQQNKIDSLKYLINTKQYNKDYYRLTDNVTSYYLSKNLDSTISLVNILHQQPFTKEYYQYHFNGYNRKGYAYYLKTNFDESINIFEKGFQFALKNKDTSGSLDLMNNIANVFLEKGNTTNALNSYLKIKDIASKNVLLSKKLSIANANIAYVYKMQGKYYEAENYYYQSLKVSQAFNDYVQVANIYNLLASLFLQKNEIDKAEKYAKDALLIQEQYKMLAGQAVSYQQLAEVYKSENNYNLMLKNLTLSKNIYEKQNDIRQLTTLYGSLASLYEKQNIFDSSYYYYNKSIVVAKKIGSLKNLSTFYNGLTKSSILLNNIADAEKNIDSAYKYITQTSGRVELKSYWLNKMAIEKKKQNFQKASEYFELYNSLNDSLLNEKNIESMNKLNIQFETDKKNLKINLLSKADSIKSLQITNQQLAINKSLFELSQQQLALAEDSILLFTQNETILQNKLDASLKEEKINTLTKEGLQKQLALQQQQAAIKQKNNTIIIIAIGAILLLVIAYAVYRKKQLQQQAFMVQEQAKQRELITKAVIDAEEAERKRIASDLHDGVGQLFSAVKMNLAGLIDRIDLPKEEDQFLAEKTLALVDESCKEVRVISHKMMPNFLLKSGIASDIRSFIEKIDESTLKIHFETKGFKEQLEFNEEVILYRVIQELIGNVIKHAQANELFLHLEKTNKQIQVQVTDNGLGFNYDNAIAKGGLGLKNILVRIEYLKGTISFTPNQPTGTIVKINIPLA